ncbi:hypothetical protein CEXT_170551 [Caerostris extrusa]|uniref:Uncharacterized protein n=1 Tax=Caerostris extrusa TaxID=172846 RepID=A0AAV4M6I5_CAEEX|nr:hypothetical protein CEXT_170551 [Caerostris extrusa]
MDGFSFKGILRLDKTQELEPVPMGENVEGDFGFMSAGGMCCMSPRIQKRENRFVFRRSKMCSHMPGYLINKQVRVCWSGHYIIHRCTFLDI